MNLFQIRTGAVAGLFRRELALALILALLFWVVGAPTFLRNAHAAELTNVYDVLSDSNLGAAATHTIGFTATDAIYAGQTITYALDPAGTSPGTSAFSEIGATATTSDFSLVSGNGTATTTYTIVSTCSAGDNATVDGNYNNNANENVVVTLCSGATAMATSSNVIFVSGVTQPVWYNATSTGSYQVSIASSGGDAGAARVAILPNVTVTATVDTSFSFTVAGLATSTTYNGITTTGSSTATALPFNTLTPFASSTLGQTLTVTTNARNGFAVTVQENQPLTSATGAIISLFDNGATTTDPITWADPNNTLNDPATYGHFGVSSDDSDMTGAANQFTGALYAGNIDVPRQVFSNPGPSDGKQQDTGFAHVMYTIEVGTLQPAGNDYTNILTYVATPTY